MASAQIVTRVGNLTRDPELRFGESGKPYARFGLAVDTPKTAGDWKGPKETVFYEVTCYDSMAKNVADSITKGTRVVVSGRPELQDYKDKEGNARQSKRIHANSVGVDLLWASLRSTCASCGVPLDAIERNAKKTSSTDDSDPANETMADF